MLSLNQIGEQVAHTRNERKLGQRELAVKAGVSRQTIDLLENGRATDLGYSRLARILAAVGLELRLEPVAGQRPTLDDLLREDLLREDSGE
jgi:transcriptional regulator with XRE-family HTH domain